MTAKITHSSSPGASLQRKIREAFLLTMRALRTPKATPQSVKKDIDVYDALAVRHVGRGLADCKVLEIGFGSQPYRFHVMHAVGSDVTGVDLDVPMLGLEDLPRIYRVNGLERALKSFVRYLITDLREWRRWRGYLGELGGRPFHVPRERLIVSDAASDEFWCSNPGPYDLIVSEDVFEHIPEKDLENVVERMHASLAPHGVAIISPMIFTGILGGHAVEIYGSYNNDNHVDTSSVPPWDHLRDKRVRPNTYLNEMPRSSYRRMFSAYFSIVEETALQGDLGMDLLTDEVADELSAFERDELFSNKVRFVLRHKHG